MIKVELSNIMGCIKSGQKYEKAGNQDESKERKQAELISAALPNIAITKPEKQKLGVLPVLVPPNKGTVEKKQQPGLFAVPKGTNPKPGDLLMIPKGSGHEKNSRINIVIPDDSQTVSKLPIERTESNFDKALEELRKLTHNPLSANHKSEKSKANEPMYPQNGMGASGGQSGKVSGVFQPSGQYGQHNPREQSNSLVIETIRSKISSNILNKDEINLQRIAPNSEISNPVSSNAANPAKQEQQNVIQPLTPNEAQGKQPQTVRPIEPINQMRKALQSKVPENGVPNINAKSNQITQVGIPPNVVGAKIQFNVESEMMATFKFKMPLPFISLEAH